MCKWIVLATIFLIPFLLMGNELSRKQYLDLVVQCPHLVLPQGDASKGEIEILIDPEKMEEIEKRTGRDVGILNQDRY